MRGQDLPEDEMLEMFRQVRDEIEPKIKNWLEHPEKTRAAARATGASDHRTLVVPERRRMLAVDLF